MVKTFEETVGVLRRFDLVFDDQVPRLPDAMPKYDDEDPCGFSIFRMELEDMDLNDLDMRRTFFGKSELVRCSFKNTNLEESNLCWNDFVEVDFSGANLSSADLRASIYESVNFSGSNLSGADLRRSDFTNCNFTDAIMIGTMLTKLDGSELPISDEQKLQISWQDSEGDEPDGG